MGLDELKAELLDQGKKESEQIASATSEIIASMRATAKKEVQSITERYEQSLAEEKEKIARHTKQEVASVQKQLLLEKKQALIDEVIEQAKEQLDKKTIAKLLLAAAEKIDIAKVYCAKEDAKEVSQGEVKEAELGGGIIAESADGTLSIDYTYPTLLKQVKERKLQQLAQVLFA